jgi:hypothetical protein
MKNHMGFIYSDPVDTPYLLSVEEKRTYELKRLIRNAIMTEFDTYSETSGSFS